MKKKTLLFYGPYIHHWWLKNIILPHLHLLSQNDWEVICYISNKFEGNRVIDHEYLPHHPQPKIKFVPAPEEFPVNINQRDYTAEETKTLAEFLAKPLRGIKPDAILVRGAGAPYLEELYPHVPRLNILEGGFPFASYMPEDFVLFTGDKIWGVDYFSRHAKHLWQKIKLTRSETESIEALRKTAKTKLHQPLVQDYVAKLRERFEKVILFPFEFFGAEAEFANKYYTLTGDQTENLKHLIERSPTDWCFLATFHPSDIRFNPYEPPNPVLAEKMKEIKQKLAGYGNVFFAQYDLGVTALTHPLVYAADAVAMQNGKTFSLCMLLDKPIINVGDLSIDFYHPIKNLNHLKAELESFKPHNRAEMNQFFYWLITRFKFPRTELGGSYVYFKAILDRATDKNISPEELYEWGTKELYAHSLAKMVAHIQG